jgi:hypothetical protein
MPPAVAPRRRSGSILFYVALSLIAAALAVVSAPVWQPQVNNLLGLRQASAPVTDDRLTALQGDVQALSEQVQAAVDSGALNEAIAAAVDPLAAQIKAAQQELAELKTRVEAMSAYLPSEAINSGTLPEMPNVDLTPLENRIAQLETSLNETSTKLGELSANQATASATPAAPVDDPRIGALSSENQALRDQVAMLNQRLEAMEALDAKVQELEPKLSALSDQVANLPKGVEQQRAAALIVTIGELRSALASDKSFTPELSALNDLTQTDDAVRPRLKPIVDELAPFADAGVPTLSQLAASFPATEIARAGEAEIATEVADDPWYQRLWHGTVHALSEVFTLRPVGPEVEGEGTLARLARAEAKVGEGDLSGAVAELKGLTGLAAEAAAEWIALAESRLTVEHAAAQLADISTRELAPQAGE